MARPKPITIRAARKARPKSRTKVSHSPQVMTIEYGFNRRVYWWLKSVIKTVLIAWATRPVVPSLSISVSLPKRPKRRPTPVVSPPATSKPTLSYFRVLKYAFVSLLMTASVIGSAYATYEYVFADLPSPTELSQRPQRLTTTITDRYGENLYQVYEDENRKLIPLSQVSPDLINATIAIEDQNFYEHHGFDIGGIARASIAYVEKKAINGGGSTITQQLVKLRLLNNERSLQRKLKELVLAILVEGNYSKDQILEMYLNEVAYGGSTYGIEAASQRYFGKSAKDLNLAEASYLAGLPQSPSVFNPFGPTPELAKSRQAEVLRRMAEDTYITPEQAAVAQSEKLAFVANTTDIQAPHFVMYVKGLLAEKYGEDLVNTGGLQVTTSLDLQLQEEAQKTVTDEVAKLARLRISNGAALVTQPQTGEILAMVGSTNYFDVAHDGQVNVTVRNRQPGSSIKPLTYALALENGFTPATMIEDAPVSYVSAGSPPYAPKNYDGSFHGNVSLRQSLASSYNIPAVKLLNAVGVNTMIDKAEEVGITGWTDRKRYGLALTLGGGEVKMTEMAQLYGTFANNGKTVALNPILEVKNQQGDVLYRNTCVLDKVNCQGHQSFDSRVAYQITSILSDNNARSPAFGLRSDLFIPGQEVAVKTGTTNEMKDNWTFGYTSDRVVSVWVGNNDGTPMSYVASGITGASPIWNDLMRLTLDADQPHHFAQPDGIVKVALCGNTGAVACGTGCGESTRSEYFLPGTEPRGCSTQGQFTYGALPQTNSPAQPNSSSNSRGNRGRGSANSNNPSPPQLDLEDNFEIREPDFDFEPIRAL